MDFASLRAKLDNIAEELAQLPEQETVAVEEDHHEKDEDGNVIPHDKIEEVEELSEFSPADMAAANKDSKAVQKSGSGMKSTSAAKPQAAGTLAQRLKTEEVEEEEVEEEVEEEETPPLPKPNYDIEKDKIKNMSGVSGWRKKKMLAEVEKKKKNDDNDLRIDY